MKDLSTNHELISIRKLVILRAAAAAVTSESNPSAADIWRSLSCEFQQSVHHATVRTLYRELWKKDSAA